VQPGIKTAFPDDAGSNLPADMMVEELPPDIILRNQFAKKLLNDWQEAAAQVTKSAQFVQQLVEENLKLNKEIQVLQSQGALQSPHMR
jgi:hypothetical protein